MAENTPLVKQIKNGWAAIGKGWAVHATTKEEAVRLFEEAQERHALIEQRDQPVPVTEEAA